MADYTREDITSLGAALNRAIDRLNALTANSNSIIDVVNRQQEQIRKLEAQVQYLLTVAPEAPDE